MWNASFLWPCLNGRLEHCSWFKARFNVQSLPQKMNFLSSWIRWSVVSCIHDTLQLQFGIKMSKYSRKLAVDSISNYNRAILICNANRSLKLYVNWFCSADSMLHFYTFRNRNFSQLLTNLEMIVFQFSTYFSNVSIV